MCCALRPLLKDLPRRGAKCEWQWMFFSTVDVLQSSSHSNSNNVALHRPGFIRVQVCLHYTICQGVIRQVFRQIYKSLLEPAFWRLLQNVSRQMSSSSIIIHLQVLNQWTWFSSSPQTVDISMYVTHPFEWANRVHYHRISLKGEWFIKWWKSTLSNMFKA